jgi:hypothetical protein
MNEELQLRIFGFVDPVEPPTGSWKAGVYELVKRGLSNSQIEALANSARRMQEAIQVQIINPRIVSNYN